MKTLDLCRAPIARVVGPATPVLLVAGLALVMAPPPLLAGGDSFTIKKGVPATSTFTIGWDTTDGYGRTYSGKMAIYGGGGNNHGNGLDPSQVATMLASDMNAAVKKAGGVGTAATASGATVTLGSFYSQPSQFQTTANFVAMSSVFPDAPIHGVIRFDPDPTTGLAMLTEPGDYSISGPGLDASFSAPTGTTADELAALAAGSMSVPGYTIDLSGDSVFFEASSPGSLTFAPDGDGLDYVLSSVPEPSSFVMVGTALLILSGIGGARRLLALVL